MDELQIRISKLLRYYQFESPKMSAEVFASIIATEIINYLKRKVN